MALLRDPSLGSFIIYSFNHQLMIYPMSALLKQQWIKHAVVCLVTQLRPTLCTLRLFCPWGFSRQKYWSGLPCPLPGDLPDPRIAPMSPATPALQVDTLPLSHQGKPTGSPAASFPACSIHLLVDQVLNLRKEPI